MSMRSITNLLRAMTLAIVANALGGCIFATTARSGAYDPAFPYSYEGTYGYTTTAAPGTVYYSGGYYGGVYYRPGFYTQRAPFVTVYGQPQAYAQPVAQPVYGQQPVYGGSTVVVQPVGVQATGAVATPIR